MFIVTLRRFVERYFRVWTQRKSRPGPYRKPTVRLGLEGLEDRRLLSASIIATGSDSGSSPLVTVYNAATGAQEFSFMAYDSSFTGGVRVAVGDVTGNGTPDIITAPGPGGGSDIKVFDGTTGQLIREFFAFDPSFNGGSYVASGDVNDDGYDDIIVGADAGGGPQVTVFSGKDDSVLASFFAYNPAFTGGVRVAAGDVTGSGSDDIIVGAGAGGGPNISVFNGNGNAVNSFFAYNPNFDDGVTVASGDLSGNGLDDIIVGSGSGGGPEVRVFSGQNNSVLDDYFAYNPSFSGGVNVGAVCMNGQTDIVTTPGQGGGPDVETVDPSTCTVVNQFVGGQSDTGLYTAGDQSNTADASAVATHFLVVTAPNVQAGAATNMVVVALSASNQIVTNYTGTVDFTSSDTGATLPASYTFTAQDHGRHVFQVTFATTGSQTVTATDSTTSTITGSVTTNVNPPDVATQFFLIVPPNVQAGTATPVTVVALDASNNIDTNYTGTVQLTSSDTGATLPASYTFQASDHGHHTFQVTFGTTGSQTVTATDTSDSSLTGSVTVNVNPADVATQFALQIAPDVQVGQATAVRVVALDASNHVVPNYTGTVQLTSSDTGATLPAAYTFQASDHGAHVFLVTFATSGSQTVTATDTSDSSLTGSVTVNVNPADVATQFAILVSRNVQVGQAASVEVVALDANNHVVTNYTGTVQLTSSDTGATLPAAYTFQASDHGEHIFQVTFATSGSQSVTATDTSTSSLTGTATVTVNPADVATHFALEAFPSTDAGETAYIGVVALDASNHVVKNYTGTVQLTSSDTGATLPAAYTFQASDRGEHVFQVTFATTGSQTVTATDTSDSSLTGSATVQVNPADVATHFGILIFPLAQAGQPVSFTVVALDAHNQIVTNYTGTVQFGSSDSGATLPASYTFQASDQGRHTFQVTFAATGNDTLTATDSSDSTLTGAITVKVLQAGGGSPSGGSSS